MRSGLYPSPEGLGFTPSGIKIHKLSADIEQMIEAVGKSGFLPLTLTMQHVAAISSLPNIHRDSFDRILIAQAISEPLAFLTVDETLKDYSDLVVVG